MMKLHCSNGRTLDYYNLQEQDKSEQVPKAEVSVTSILFDEAHGELLRSQSFTAGDDTSTWNELGKLLQERFGDTSVSRHVGGLLTPEILLEHKILVLAAPTELFTTEEVEAITQFVLDGNSLLIAATSRSLYEQLDKRSSRGGQDVNSLLKNFGLQFKSLLTSPSGEISDLYPHFLSSEVNRLFVSEPAYLELLPDIWQELPQPPRIVAKLPHTNEPWLVTVEPVYKGRVVAISDVVVFADDYLIDGNKQLAINIFRWLAFENQLDCFATQINPEIQYGETATFSISLHNPQDRRLEYISCLLESETGTEILDPEEKNIRSLAPYTEAQLHWTIKPTRLGLQKLKLTIDCLKEPRFMPFFFDVAAQFNCIPDVEFDLIMLNTKGEISEISETGTPIEVKVGLRPKTGVSSTPMQFNLTSSSSELVVETFDSSRSDHWRLTAESAGDYPITLVIGETGQRVSRLLRVYPSVQDRISGLENDTIIRINQEIYRQVKKLECGLEVEDIQQTPFRLYTPEDYAHLLYPGNTEILDVLRAARQETRENQRLVQMLLKSILPFYSPMHGCCIPYDPPLAAQLVESHPYYQEYLAENFLCLDEENQTYLEQNLAALMLHERYGHGFFYTQTTLGKQFSILFRHGLYPGANPSQMKSPYPRLLYEEYKSVLQELWKSVIMIDEGFATWVELAVLPRLPGTMGQGAFRRKVFLFSDAQARYQRGYDYFQSIQDTFGSKVVIQVMLEAADIDIGVTEEGGKIRFSLDAKTLMGALQSTPQSTIRADVRLEKIHGALYESSQKARLKQDQIKYGRGRGYSDTLISTLIRESIGVG